MAASYVFYAADSPGYLVLLLWVTLVSHRGGHLLHERRSGALLAACVLLCAAPLAVFKVGQLVGLGGPAAGAGVLSAVPIGISFYTLQAVSSLVDVYRRSTPPSDDLPTHALYLAFFPQLLAGPIERVSHLVPQLRTLRMPSAEDLFLGAKTLLWGYFCKLVVADNLAGIVDSVLREHDRVPAASLPVSLCLYSFQLYFDFLGYTMIAIGLARTFGIGLSRNFARPYLAAGIREFWRRWHVTLSTWLRDYVYKPLGGRDRGYARYVVAIVTTFVVSGVWHGGGMNFILWGLLHASMLLIEDAYARFRPASRHGSAPVHRVLGILATFSLVSFAWLFFRVTDLGHIAEILRSIGGWVSAGFPLALAPVFSRPDTHAFLALLAIAFLLDSWGTADAVRRTVPGSRYEIARELAVVNLLVVALVLFGDLGHRAFIYFRF